MNLWFVRKDFRWLADLLSAVTILPFDYQAAQHAAQIRVQLELAGTPIGPFDLLIAATAQANHAALVTHNTAEFGRIDGLKIIDWFE